MKVAADTHGNQYEYTVNQHSGDIPCAYMTLLQRMQYNTANYYTIQLSHV